MRISITILIILSITCNVPTSTSSYWESQKNQFKYQNKSEFGNDSTIKADLKSLKKSHHPLFAAVRSKTVYLYSWQQRDETKNEFTVIKDDGEFGWQVFYFILDKKDSLISSAKIAEKSMEGNYWFVTIAAFKTKDTIVTVRSLAPGYDRKTQKVFSPVHSYFIIEKGVLMRIHEIKL